MARPPVERLFCREISSTFFSESSEFNQGTIREFGRFTTRYDIFTMKHTFGAVSLLAFIMLFDPSFPVQANPPEDKDSGSYCFKMAAGSNNTIQLSREVYVPQPGDVILFDDHDKLWTAIYRMVGTSSPLHSAIVFRRPNGRIALLEAGYQLKLKVFILEVVPRLHNHSGTILIRRLKTPLSPEQSDKLAQFALAQEGKSYSLGRLLMQVTPIRPRGPIRRALLGRTLLNRDRWTCSELVVAAATSCGILNPSIYFANAMYPHDIAYDEDFDLSPYYYEPVLWYPHAELQMIGNCIVTGSGTGALESPQPLPQK